MTQCCRFGPAPKCPQLEPAVPTRCSHYRSRAVAREGVNPQAPHSSGIAGVSNKQTNLLIAFPKLKGTKPCEVRIPKRPGSSLKSADWARGAVGLDQAFRKERREMSTGHSHLLSWFHPFINLPPFPCNLSLKNGHNTFLHSPDCAGRRAVRIKQLMVMCFFETLLGKLLVAIRRMITGMLLAILICKNPYRFKHAKQRRSSSCVTSDKGFASSWQLI